MWKQKRAQAWAIDLSIALIIFIGVIFLFYRYSISFASEDSLVNKIAAQGGYASSTLLTTGYPPDWNNSDDLDKVISIGLLNEEGLLDENKINKFREWAESNYELTKKKINTRYNYYIEFYEGEGSAPFLPIGKTYEGAKQIVKTQRISAYRDIDTSQIKAVKIILYLWTN